MLRITKLTDYAVLVLSDMVRADGFARAARDIAESTRIPQPTVSKVLKLLARSTLVESERGKNGGYKLSRGADNISVADIVDAVEGPIAVTECSAHQRGSCDLEGKCPTETNWIRINDAIRQALRAVTLADMVKPNLPVLIPLRRLVAEA
ncbi:MAG TPA: SUF system Fe-S cluster assembly regulator [Polyangiaceae bacterium]|jgi:FeS assembly SUF system regulator|nr:SUF system Fe-S cluster assembly regulator [Polyangiaceae bacterium]